MDQFLRDINRYPTPCYPQPWYPPVQVGDPWPPYPIVWSGDSEPQPSDGPEFHADHTAWAHRQ